MATCCVELNGGMCNILSQIMKLLVFANEHKMKPILDNNHILYPSERDKQKHSLDKRKDFLDIIKKIVSCTKLEFGKIRNFQIIKEFDEEKGNYTKNVLLKGYWVKNIFYHYYILREKKINFIHLKKFFDGVKITDLDYKNICCVHIRRGDYLLKEHFIEHSPCEIQYFISGIEKMKSLGINKFIILCTDSRIKFMLSKVDTQLFYSDGDQYQDMLIMSKCENFILSPSSFSMLGVVISKAKNVIYPEPWSFGKYMKKLNHYDLKNINFIKIERKFMKLEEFKENERTFFKNINYFPKQEIEKRIKKLSSDKKLDIYLINLKYRTDRLNNILSQNLITDNFNINIFDAVKASPGEIGCALSHLNLIKYAKDNNFKYIIVMEDDCLFKFNILDKVEKLILNIDNFEVFNGSMTFWDKRENYSHVKSYKSFDDDFMKVSWGQTATFMIYSYLCFDKILDMKVKAKYHIDQFIPNNFLQLSYRQHFCKQQSSFSDLAEKNVDNEKYFDEMNILLENLYLKRENNVPTIGIFGIFLGPYTRYLEDYIDTIDKNFIPYFKKKYYLIIDENYNMESKENFFIKKIKSLEWPYPTLMRFKLGLKFKDICDTDYNYFLNSNVKCINIGTEVLPSKDYIFCQNHSIIMNKIFPYGNNKKSTSYTKNKKYYIAGGFYGAKRENFFEMYKLLDKNTDIDLENNIIAEWHDETHLNKFFNDNLKANADVCTYYYHVPEERMQLFDKEKIKIIYKEKTETDCLVKTGKRTSGKIDKEVINYLNNV